jgi:hypothetical protein
MGFNALIIVELAPLGAEFDTSGPLLGSIWEDQRIARRLLRSKRPLKSLRFFQDHLLQ